LVKSEIENSKDVNFNFERSNSIAKAKFTEIERKRKVNPCFQFGYIFMRNFSYLVKHPGTLAAIQINSIILGLLCLAIFWQIGKIDDSKLEDIANEYLVSDHNKATLLITTYLRGKVENWTGIIQCLTLCIVMNSALAVIMQIPL
jgi:hypothetical protein